MVVSEGHFAFLVISNSPDTVWVSKIWTRSAVIHRQHQYWCGQASLYHSVGSAYEVPPVLFDLRCCPLLSGSRGIWFLSRQHIFVVVWVHAYFSLSPSAHMGLQLPASLLWDGVIALPLCSWFPFLQGKCLVGLCAYWHGCQCFLLLIISVCIHLQRLLEFLFV